MLYIYSIFYCKLQVFVDISSLLHNTVTPFKTWPLKTMCLHVDLNGHLHELLERM